MTTLEEVRTQIADIDYDIIDLIHKRVDLAEKVLEAKQKDVIKINDSSQNHVVLDRAVSAATENNLDTGYVKEIFEILLK